MMGCPQLLLLKLLLSTQEILPVIGSGIFTSVDIFPYISGC